MDLNTLHQLGVIDINKPMWWDWEYTPDPRELVGIDEFKKRLWDLGHLFYLLMERPQKEKIFLYVADKVPITLINAEIFGGDFTFFATARPYNQSEVNDHQFPKEKLEKQVKEDGYIFLEYHFLPHIRGIFKESIGSHMFWYPIKCVGLDPLIKEAIGDLDDIFRIWGSYEVGWYTKIGSQSTSDASPRHPTAYHELKKKRLISGKKFVRHDVSKLEEVAYDEFVKRAGESSPMVAVYPIRHPNLDETIPLVLSTRTHSESKRSGPTVLGVMGNNSFRQEYRIWRIRDEQFCKDISQILEGELRTKFDVVWFKSGSYKLINS